MSCRDCIRASRKRSALECGPSDGSGIGSREQVPGRRPLCGESEPLLHEMRESSRGTHAGLPAGANLHKFSFSAAVARRNWRFPGFSATPKDDATNELVGTVRK